MGIERFLGEKILTCPGCGYAVAVLPVEGNGVLPDIKCPICTAVLHQSVLSRREKQVVEQLVAGLSTREVAKKLSVSIKTIESHRQMVFKKLRIRDLANLTKYALQNGLTNPEVICRGMK